MSVYKQPVKIPNPDISYPSDPNNVSASDSTNDMPARRVSGGNPARNDVKTSGIKQRGSGAATKEGFTSRGPMA
jgi:hypothetical protein